MVGWATVRLQFRKGRVAAAWCESRLGLDAVLRPFLFTAASFSWLTGEVEPPTGATAVLTADGSAEAAIITEGLRRRAVWQRMLQDLPPLDARLMVDFAALSIHLGELRGVGKELCRLCDGRRTFAEVIRDAAAPELEATSILGHLLVRGILVHGPEARVSPASALAVEARRQAAIAADWPSSASGSLLTGPSASTAARTHAVDTRTVLGYQPSTAEESPPSSPITPTPVPSLASSGPRSVDSNQPLRPRVRASSPPSMSSPAQATGRRRRELPRASRVTPTRRLDDIPAVGEAEPTEIVRVSPARSPLGLALTGTVAGAAIAFALSALFRAPPEPEPAKVVVLATPPAAPIAVAVNPGAATGRPAASPSAGITSAGAPAESLLGHHGTTGPGAPQPGGMSSGLKRMGEPPGSRPSGILPAGLPTQVPKPATPQIQPATRQRIALSTVPPREASVAERLLDVCDRGRKAGGGVRIDAACEAAIDAGALRADLFASSAERALEGGDFAKAAARARRALILDPKLAEAYAYLGFAEGEAGRERQAAIAYRRYLSLAPAGRFADDVRAILRERTPGN